MQNPPINPMNVPNVAVTRVRLCGAKTRAGHSCRNPGLPNGRCKFHGGLSPGAPRGNRNAWKHGTRSGEYQAMRRLLREMRGDLAELGE